MVPVMTRGVITGGINNGENNLYSTAATYSKRRCQMKALINTFCTVLY